MTNISSTTKRVLLNYKRATGNEVGQKEKLGMSAALKSIVDTIKLHQPLGNSEIHKGIFLSNQSICDKLISVASELEGK